MSHASADLHNHRDHGDDRQHEHLSHPHDHRDSGHAHDDDYDNADDHVGRYEHAGHSQGSGGHAHHDHELEGSARRQQALLRGAIALGIGLYLVYLQVSGEIGNYINIRFNWIALAGAAFALVLGAHTVAANLFLKDPTLGTGDDHEHGDHVHAQLRWPALLMLAIPLALAVLVPARPLGASAVSGISFLENAAATDTAAISASDSLEWSVLDWLRVYSFGGAVDRMNGKPADVTGFIFRNEGDPQGYLIVSRFLMVHCTADSYAIGMPARWEGADSLPADTWVRVRGTVRIGQFGGNTLPIIDASSVETIAQPAQVYLYQ